MSSTSNCNDSTLDIAALTNTANLLGIAPQVYIDNVLKIRKDNLLRKQGCQSSSLTHTSPAPTSTPYSRSSSSEKELELQRRVQKSNQVLTLETKTNDESIMLMLQKLAEKEKQLNERDKELAEARERMQYTRANDGRMGAVLMGGVHLGAVPMGAVHIGAVPYGLHMGGFHRGVMPERQTSHSLEYNFTPSDSSRGLSRIAPNLVRF